jgi:hypothetical protein
VPKSPLDKLGFKPGMTGWTFGRPDALAAVVPLPAGGAPAAPPDVTVAFVHAAADVAPALERALPYYADGRALWFAYPKKSGAIATDITRDRGWEPMAAHDLLAVTQVAVDDTWSALRFRRRAEIRTLTRRSERAGARPAAPPTPPPGG